MPEFARKQVTSAAQSFVGLSADPSDMEARGKYLELIAPGETHAMAEGMAKASGCGLVVAGIWRAAGLKHKKLDPPYQIGYAIDRLIKIGQEFGGWVLADGHKMPQPGDMVMVGDNSASGGVTHVYTAMTIDSEKMIITSVDGGQVTPKGFQLVMAKKRTWKNGRDLVFFGTDPGGNAVGGRKIIGWVDVGVLPFEADEEIYGP